MVESFAPVFNYPFALSYSSANYLLRLLSHVFPSNLLVCLGFHVYRKAISCSGASALFLCCWLLHSGRNVSSTAGYIPYESLDKKVFFFVGADCRWWIGGCSALDD